jgi:hypothetical protein
MAHWYEGQLRILQTVLRETDIASYDAGAVAAYMRDNHANTLVVNAGGIVDFFHNDVEPAHHNPFMKQGQEILDDLCRVLHENDMRVMVRVDFRGVQKYRYEARPDWFARQADGSPKVNEQGLYTPCYLSAYANDHAVEFIRAMMERFPVDGVWENSITFGSGVCYCKRCQDDYRAATGREIPVGEDEAEPAFAPYRAWRKEKAMEHLRRIRACVKEFGEEKAYAAEVFGMHHASGSIHSGIDTYAATLFDFCVGVGFLTGAPHGRPYDEVTYAASATRFLKAIAPDKTTVLLTGNNGTKWRLVKDPSLETKLWMWEAVSVGANFWNCHFNGQHPAATEDRRNAGLEKEVYGYLARNAEILHDQHPVAEVAIVFSQPTRDRFGKDDEAKDGYGVGIKGLEAVLIDEHIPYGFLTERDVSDDALHGVRVLCLPNCACLSDEQAAAIRRYVNWGGKLLASFETSLYDETGARRADFALADVLGVHDTGLVKDTSKDCYQMIRLGKHPLLDGMQADKTRFLINGGRTVLARPQGEGESVCTYVPIIPNQYPEQAWIRTMETDYPTIYAHRFGSGEAVYFANEMEAMAYKNGHEDFRDAVRNALAYLRRDSRPILRTDAPDSTHIALTRGGAHPSDYILSFVNVLSSGRKPIRRLHAAAPCRVTLLLPGATSAHMRTLNPSAHGNAHILDQVLENAALRLTLSIPAFDEFFALHIHV